MNSRVVPDVVIRHARPDEAETLSAIARRAKAVWDYPAEWLEAWRDDLTLSPAYLGRHRAFVAAIDGRPAGTCVLQDMGSTWSIEHLWIDPSCQGRGLGRALVEHALRTARSVRRSPVDVVADPNAERFYARMGARRTGAEPAPMPGAPDRVLPVLRFDTDDGP